MNIILVNSTTSNINVYISLISDFMQKFNRDKYLGSLMTTLKTTGYYDDTAIDIITDHGNYKAKNKDK